jgi:hypothetical protein
LITSLLDIWPSSPQSLLSEHTHLPSQSLLFQSISYSTSLFLTQINHIPHFNFTPITTMRSVSTLRNLRSIKAAFEKPEYVPRFLNNPLSPNTRAMFAKRVGWTFVWLVQGVHDVYCDSHSVLTCSRYSAAVSVLWWPMMASKIMHGEIAI